jgi:hypothetical protein
VLCICLRAFIPLISEVLNPQANYTSVGSLFIM